VLSLSLSLFCAPASLAAYVQSRACLDNNSKTNSSHGGSNPSGLRASLISSPDHHGISRLQLTLYEQPIDFATCEQDKISNVTSSVRITSLGSLVGRPMICRNV